MIIKCLALWQPWATLYAHGIKLIETRGSYSSHRGLTGIHATLDPASFRRQNEKLFYEFPFYNALKALGYDRFEDLPRGGVIGATNIIYWKKMVYGTPKHPSLEMNYPTSTKEKAFGHYEVGRYGIFSSEVHLFSTRFPAKGTQSLLTPIDIPQDLLDTAKIIQLDYSKIFSQAS